MNTLSPQIKYGFKMPQTPYTSPEYGGYGGIDEEEKKRQRWAALAQIGQGMGASGGGSGVVGGALGGAGTGAALGTAVLPGVGTAVGAGIGALVGGIGAGIQGGKEEKLAKDAADRANRSLDLTEKGMNLDQLNTERRGGLDALRFLAENRSNAIQRRNRSLFKNDLMRVIGRT